MKKAELNKLTPPEFEIMDAVWCAGEITTIGIFNTINISKPKKLKRTTIQVQVARLERKGWLTHREDGNRFLFRSTVSREEVLSAIVMDVLERVFDGSCVEMVKPLLTNSNISSDEIKELREFIYQYEKK